MFVKIIVFCFQFEFPTLVKYINKRFKTQKTFQNTTLFIKRFTPCRNIYIYIYIKEYFEKQVFDFCMGRS